MYNFRIGDSVQFQERGAAFAAHVSKIIGRGKAKRIEVVHAGVGFNAPDVFKTFRPNELRLVYTQLSEKAYRRPVQKVG